VTYKEWSTSPEWINFRKGGTHLVQRISAMWRKAGGKEGGKTRADEAVVKTQGVRRTRKYSDQQRLLTHGSGACIAQRLLLEVVLERDVEDPYAVQKTKVSSDQSKKD
jgi:hypothetical protein